MLITRDIPNVEILAVGNKVRGAGCPASGCAFTEEQLDNIAAAFTESKVDAPIKIGHSANQRLLREEGLPAAGWVTNLRRVGNKLLADFKAVPGKIADLIDSGAYLNRSAEMFINYETGGKMYPHFLTGVALLGEELPAFDNLAAITAAYKDAQLELNPEAVAVLFTADEPEHHRASVVVSPATFASEGEAAITALAAFTSRAKSRAAFRSAEGRTLSQDNRELLVRLAESAKAALAELETLSAEPHDPANDQDYASVMRASLVQARLSMAALGG